ncbi:MAG TPA: hypothetical protein VGK24_12175 [Candidatus Angelobacter sp.]
MVDAHAHRIVAVTHPKSLTIQEAMTANYEGGHSSSQEGGH